MVRIGKPTRLALCVQARGEGSISRGSLVSGTSKMVFRSACLGSRWLVVGGMIAALAVVAYKLNIKIIVIKNNTLGQIKWEPMVFLGNPEYGCALYPSRIRHDCARGGQRRDAHRRSLYVWGTPRQCPQP